MEVHVTLAVMETFYHRLPPVLLRPYSQGRNPFAFWIPVEVHRVGGREEGPGETQAGQRVWDRDTGGRGREGCWEDLSRRGDKLSSAPFLATT